MSLLERDEVNRILKELTNECLKYEDDLYTEFREDLPEVGEIIKHNNEDVTVISVDIPNRKYTILTESGTKEEIFVPLKCSGKCGKNRN